MDLTWVAAYASARGVTFDMRNVAATGLCNVAATGFRAGFLHLGTRRHVMLNSFSVSSRIDTSLADAGDVKTCLNV